VEYGYNENSQIDTLLYQSGAFLSLSYFNQRNWVTASESRENKMGYQLDYYLNGNVKSRKVMGNYRLNYQVEQREMNSVYTYDKANRLTNVNRFNVKSYSPVEAFSYDKDGNLQTLTRDYSGDNFTYRYYSGTNRLMNITGTEVPQYIYDYNGNVTADSVRKITGITYDYRNLPVEMNITPNNGDRYKYKMRYKYDEAGNRIRKMKYRSRLGEENWTLYNDEVYIRDAKGNETAMYENSNLQYINIWGAGLEGKVRKDDRGNNLFSYYYKDHLGSVTAVMDGASGTITQSQDYDAWGDICRTYSTTDTTVNKFTGKERDTETGYDYFGARYYDSRIGRRTANTITNTYTAIDTLLSGTYFILKSGSGSTILCRFLSIIFLAIIQNKNSRLYFQMIEADRIKRLGSPGNKDLITITNINFSLETF
jgi:RHS repeat-associated protein